MNSDPSTRARELFSSTGFYCAESVLLAVAEHLDIHSDLIPRIATGFCSGIARTGGMCGAVSGGIMAIGLSLGRNEPSDDLDPCYQAVQAFLERFSTHYKALSCLDLTCVDLSTPDGQATFRIKGQIHLCTEYVENAARYVVEIISNSGRN
jgi:C_GCAxxG_C_C family probable redox protein